jgi:glycosyltransferase involved in cell wall biosynthesis
LVIDNNSSDDTKSVCLSFADKIPIRYIFEERQGKSFALNRGLAEAQAPLLLLTDDDVSVTTDWVVSLLNAASRHPECDYFGGRIKSQLEVTPPSWFAQNQHWLEINPRIDFGKNELLVKDVKKMCFVGANFAIRKSVFSREICYSEEFGPKGSFFTPYSHHGGEEVDLQFKMAAQGIKGLYVPSSLVYHRDPPHRMTEKYLRWFYQAKGREKILAGDFVLTPRQWLRVPKYLWRRFFYSVFKYILTRWTRPSRTWLEHEIKAAITWGEIKELRKRSLATHTSRALKLQK